MITFIDKIITDIEICVSLIRIIYIIIQLLFLNDYFRSVLFSRATTEFT